MVTFPKLCQKLFDAAKSERRIPFHDNGAPHDLGRDVPGRSTTFQDYLVFGKEGLLARWSAGEILRNAPRSSLYFEDQSLWNQQRDAIHELCGRFFSPTGQLPSFVWVTRVWLTTPGGKVLGKKPQEDWHTESLKKPSRKELKAVGNGPPLLLSLRYDKEPRKNKRHFLMGHISQQDDVQLLIRRRTRVYESSCGYPLRHHHRMLILGTPEDLARMERQGLHPIRSDMVVREFGEGFCGLFLNVVMIATLHPAGPTEWPADGAKVDSANARCVTVSFDRHDGRTFTVNDFFTSFELLVRLHLVLRQLLEMIPA